MYLNTTVKIPEIKGKIITKRKGGTTYILYQYGSEYNQDKRYAVPLRTIVGKVSPRFLKSSRSLTGAAVSRSVPASLSGK